MILEIIENHRPYSLSLERLKGELQSLQVDFVEEELMRLIQHLQTEGVVILSKSTLPDSFLNYIGNYSRNWPLYAGLLVSLTETLLVIYESSFFLAVALRLLLGVGLLGFIPGYFTVRVVFPEGRLSTLEWLILSIFLSVLISAGTGIVLGLGPFFQAAIDVLALSLYTELMAVAATYRLYAAERRLANQSPALEGTTTSI